MYTRAGQPTPASVVLRKGKGKKDRDPSTNHEDGHGAPGGKVLRRFLKVPKGGNGHIVQPCDDISRSQASLRRRPLSYGPYHHPRIDPKPLFQRVGQGLQGEA